MKVKERRGRRTYARFTVHDRHRHETHFLANAEDEFRTNQRSASASSASVHPPFSLIGPYVRYIHLTYGRAYAAHTRAFLCVCLYMCVRACICVYAHVYMYSRHAYLRARDAGAFNFRRLDDSAEGRGIRTRNEIRSLG